MFQNLLTYLKEGDTYLGLEISEIQGEETYTLLEVKNSKGELVISSENRVSDIKDLKTHIKTKVPVLLSINTPNIVAKIIDINGSPTAEALVNEAFPDLDTDNFYYEIAQQERRPLISVAKKAYIDDILIRLGDEKVKPVRFSLGIGPMEKIAPYLNSTEVCTGHQKLMLENGFITKLSTAVEPCVRDHEINGLIVNSSHLLAFSHIVAYLDQSPGGTNFKETNDTFRSEFQNRRVFNLVLRSGLLFFMGLLSVNFFVFNHYHDKVGNLGAIVASSTSQRDNLIRLESAVERKKERFETLTGAANSKSTHYLDELAKNLPPTILLDGIRYQPLAKPVRESKPIAILKNRVLVSGISKDGKGFSDWLEELENAVWISNVETLDYDYISKESSSFSIKILFHED